MRIIRLFAVAGLAAVFATLPVSKDPGMSAGLTLATALCSEGRCGLSSKMDCVCPDIQIPNSVPRCNEPISP